MSLIGFRSFCQVPTNVPQGETGERFVSTKIWPLSLVIIFVLPTLVDGNYNGRGKINRLHLQFLIEGKADCWLVCHVDILKLGESVQLRPLS